MRAIRISIDEKLLEALDSDPEVKRVGRSAVLRRAAYEYLRSKRRKEIADAYERAYGAGADDELVGWEKAAAFTRT